MPTRDQPWYLRFPTIAREMRTLERPRYLRFQTTQREMLSLPRIVWSMTDSKRSVPRIIGRTSDSSPAILVLMKREPGSFSAAVGNCATFHAKSTTDAQLSQTPCKVME